MEGDAGRTGRVARRRFFLLIMKYLTTALTAAVVIAIVALGLKLRRTQAELNELRALSTTQLSVWKQGWLTGVDDAAYLMLHYKSDEIEAQWHKRANYVHAAYTPVSSLRSKDKVSE